MTTLASDRIWRKRLDEIDTIVEDIRFPDVDDANSKIDQDEEWCEVVVDGQRRRIRFHDYSEVFKIPGLYELLFYERLQCCSPSCVAKLLTDVARDFDDSIEEFRVLDVGAGNGMVGDELAHLGVEQVFGVDITPSARKATERDRPSVYDGYLVTDLTNLPESHEETLRKQDFNCLTTVAALGYGDIPAAAFLKALDLVRVPGWLAFNIKEDFLREEDSSGFSKLIRQLSREELIQVQCYRRYQHRVSMTGEPLYYVAMIAQKLDEVPGELIEYWQQ